MENKTGILGIMNNLPKMIKQLKQAKKPSFIHDVVLFGNKNYRDISIVFWVSQLMFLASITMLIVC